jgi:hypothetical protein
MIAVIKENAIVPQPVCRRNSSRVKAQNNLRQKCVLERIPDERSEYVLQLDVVHFVTPAQAPASQNGQRRVQASK